MLLQQILATRGLQVDEPIAAMLDRFPKTFIHYSSNLQKPNGTLAAQAPMSHMRIQLTLRSADQSPRDSPEDCIHWPGEQMRADPNSVSTITAFNPRSDSQSDRTGLGVFE